jgi:alkanesulfonate monooxygenase SsuD/methylene tetrahydromethanopterin reductase-like flavin-dependent oxidoreductase (luciferase family)
VSGLELRGGVRAAPLPGTTPQQRRVLRYAADTRHRDADPEHIARCARAEEADGIESALVVSASAWPDPWLVASWALASTTTLRVALTHRIGTTAPTVAARALQTLDRLSGGRAGVHLILGSSDDDVRRDGDTLGKPERYERAAEFLDVFTRTLHAREPFDAGGPHWPVRDAWSGLPPSRPELSFAGSSDAGIALAALYADVYGLVPDTPDGIRATVARVRGEAAAHGRTLRIWMHARLLLGESDDAAHADAERLLHDARDHDALVGDPQWIARVAPPGAPIPTAAEQVRAGLQRTTIGAPDTVARELYALREAGVDVLQLAAPAEDERDRELRRALIAELRRLEAVRGVAPATAAR